MNCSKTRSRPSGRTTACDAAGTVRTVRARHGVGCGGASGTVRWRGGPGLEDLGSDEPWLFVDMLVNERGLAKLPVTSVQYCEPERSWQLLARCLTLPGAARWTLFPQPIVLGADGAPALLDDAAAGAACTTGRGMRCSCGSPPATFRRAATQHRGFESHPLRR